MSERETYLGDGLYARYDGMEIWLRAPREDGDHEVCLDVGMLKELQGLVENYDPSPWCSACGARRQADCHCGPIADNE
jgi:hypothetical protein